MTAPLSLFPGFEAPVRARRPRKSAPKAMKALAVAVAEIERRAPHDLGSALWVLISAIDRQGPDGDDVALTLEAAIGRLQHARAVMGGPYPDESIVPFGMREARS